MIESDKILKEMRVTEKTSLQTANLNQYTFEVFPDANRRAVAAAIEAVYDVKVSRVNILRQSGKFKRSRTQRGVYGRTAAMKKAIVTLQEGESIATGV